MAAWGVPSTTWGSLWLAQDPKAILDTTASGSARADEDRIIRRRRGKVVAAIAGGERRTSVPGSGRDEAPRRRGEILNCGSREVRRREIRDGISQFPRRRIPDRRGGGRGRRVVAGAMPMADGDARRESEEESWKLLVCLFGLSFHQFRFN